jgi:DNA-binding transcriptional MerR regulator
MPDGTYSLSDLCDLADVTPRTVRYYISQGLLRSPGTSGPGARYDDGHLARLRLVRRLQREHLPLAEIRARLASLTDEDAIAQAEGPAEAPADSALDYVRGVLGMRNLRTPPKAIASSAVGTRPQVPSNRPATRPAPMLPPVARRLAMPSIADDGFVAQGAVMAADLAAPVLPEPSGAERSHWERFVLAPDVELHVRRPLTRSQNRAVTRLLEAARQLLEEDQP